LGAGAGAAQSAGKTVWRNITALAKPRPRQMSLVNRMIFESTGHKDPQGTTKQMRFPTLWLTFVLLLAIVSPLQGQLSGDNVRQSISRGVEYVKSQQNKRTGSWNGHDDYPEGLTSLVTLALLNAGEDIGQRHMQRALDQIRAVKRPTKVYATALRTMVLCAASPKADRATIEENVRWLLEVQVKSGQYAGGWPYGVGSRPDNSNTQFALLGLYEAQRVGIPVPREVWERSRDYFRGSQRSDGSWSYYETPAAPTPSTGSMTCAGVCSLVICEEALRYSGVEDIRDITCCGESDQDRAIQRGLDWLGRFPLTGNPGSGSYVMYFLYGIERTGRLTGQRFLGDHDWYREGASFLLGRQDSLNGAWRANAVENDPIVSTAFAILFLSKGRRPVLISRLNHSTDKGSEDWNQHKRSLRNLTQHVENSWKKPLSWQTLRMRNASVTDLLKSPVIFISGQKSLQFSTADEQMLKEYVEQGGFLFVEACNGQGCRGEEFDRSFRAFIARQFPESPLRALAPDHPVWYAETAIKPNDLPKDLWLHGVDACCRTSIVYCPQPLSCYWDMDSPLARADLPAAIRANVLACTNLGINVLAYATNRELRDKLDPVAMSNGVRELAEVRGVFRLPKLAHNGGANDAANAAQRILAALSTEVDMQVSGEHIMLSPADPNLLDHPVVFMHGRRAFRFSARERKAITTYLERGGFVFADSICASKPFSDSFRREFQAAVPGAVFETLAEDHELLSDTFSGGSIRQVTLRDPQSRTGDEPVEASLRRTFAQLEVLKIDDRIAVVFSPFDISCGLENQSSPECKGYIQEDAAKIAINAILYGLGQ
jgi:hypothetical protein